MSELVIFAVSFDSEGVVVSYMDAATDVRVEGAVAMQHQVKLHVGHPDYGEDIEVLEHQVKSMLRNALADFRDSPPWTPEDDDEDDEKGMGE